MPKVEKTIQKPSSEGLEVFVSHIEELFSLRRQVAAVVLPMLSDSEREQLHQICISGRDAKIPKIDNHGLNIEIFTLRTVLLFVEKLDADRDIIMSILLAPFVAGGSLSLSDVQLNWNEDIASLIESLQKVSSFSTRNSAVNQENFRGLLLSLARDIRVIIIMIVRSLSMMRAINHHPDEEWVKSVSFEAKCLYAQLAHRLGLYYIKGELEDLALKYTNRDIYMQIAHKLNETKRNRDAYITSFIAPVKKKLEEAGLRFDIKGRTKSISSIWAKMCKQRVDLSGIYDLFAIRIIIDTSEKREKADCWNAYSIITDMYTANPSRMKDWITFPKSNGYESLHTTVMGPGGKWVEIQIRTRRMDLIAEKGLAAHWRYKGVKSDSTDQWMNNIRDILETADSGPMQLMRNVKMDIYNREIFAFTPKGDLFRLPFGATVLDFAFHIHSNIGCHCTGAIVNGRHEKITYKIKNGDTLEILTSSSQTPKQDWLSAVVSSKARNKIKQVLNEDKQHRAELGKELLERRFRNRKIDIEDSVLMKAIKKLGYKFVNDFYIDVHAETVDIARVISLCRELEHREHDNSAATSADKFIIQNTEYVNDSEVGDVLVIGDSSIKGLNYKFARCCSPVYGDNVFGFISANGVVKIHRCSCPNAANMRHHYPYRLIKVQWSGSVGNLLPVTLKIVGHDDIGIVTNITSIISKERNMNLRNISIDSHDGIFQGYLVIGVSDTSHVDQLLKKIRTIKGVKSVERG